MEFPVDPQEIIDLRRVLKDAGLRSTAARLAVLQRLRRSSSPMTHAELAAELVPLGFDKATVFRNLNDLANVDLLVRTELGDHVWRFEVRDPNAGPGEGQHPHFVCVDCGQVTCLGGLEFTKDTREQARKVGRVTEILLKGHCVECS